MIKELLTVTLSLMIEGLRLTFLLPILTGLYLGLTLLFTRIRLGLLKLNYLFKNQTTGYRLILHNCITANRANYPTHLSV